MTIYSKADSETGDYFFNVYGQFVIKNTHSSSGHFIGIVLSFTILFPTKDLIIDLWLMKRPLERYCEGP